MSMTFGLVQAGGRATAVMRWYVTRVRGHIRGGSYVFQREIQILEFIQAS